MKAWCLLLAALALGGCATLPAREAPRGSAGGTPASRSTPRQSPASHGPAAQSAARAVVDSGPSEDARRVLASLPEPIPEGERIPPPEMSHASAASSAALDSAGGAIPDSARASIPVPAPTVPLGERPGGGAIPDSALRPSAPLTPAVAPAATAASRPAPATTRPDTCWRLQIVAPAAKARAESFRAAAASQLLVPFVIEHERTLYKVRSQDCMPRASAEALKSRAKSSGFSGAFLMTVAPRDTARATSAHKVAPRKATSRKATSRKAVAKARRS